MIPLFKVFTAPEAAKNVQEVLESGYTGQGPKVEKLEEVLRNHFGNPYINTLNSCTSGLHLALHIIKKLNTEKTEVLTTPLTCLATNLPILANDLTIKWVDTDIETCNIDLLDLERKISKNTLAILLVHWGGNPVNLNQLKQIQNKCFNLYGYRPPIIEDCAHAFGAKFEENWIGNSGNYCVFSLQSIKTFSCGDGGFLISPDDNIHKMAKLKRWFYLDRTSAQSFRCHQNINDWGFKFHMNDISAAIALSSYPYVMDLVKKQQENTTFYNENLKNIPGLRQINIHKGSSCWLYTIFVENREDFCKKLSGVETSQVHRRNDINDCFDQFRCFLPNLDWIDKRHVCIPCGWWVSPEERELIVQLIKEGW